MKHSLKITILLLGMFLIAQLIGLGVTALYSPEITQKTLDNGTVVDFTNYNLPYNMDPPQDINQSTSLASIIIAFIIAIAVMFALMKLGTTIFLRIWFFIVISLALGIAINAPLHGFLKYSSIIALLIAIPIAYVKVFKRNILVHNITELLVYPGIAVIFIPLLSIWTAVILLILISIYDMYAVWKSGVMQKMAKYQMNTLKIFAGLFIPYLKKGQRDIINKSPKSLKMKKMKVSVAILGGGDIVFPIILSGVVMRSLGFWQATLIPLGALIGLGYLLYVSEKGKFYPAMPFISIGCFLGLAIAYLV